MSKQPRDGGQAFPMLGDVSHNADWVTTDGMTLRDWFAGQAVEALIRIGAEQVQSCACGETPERPNSAWYFGIKLGCSKLGADAYEVADALLAARNREQSG